MKKNLRPVWMMSTLLFVHVLSLSAQMVSTLAGTGTPGFVNGAAALSGFDHPRGVCVDNAGNVYVADRNNQVIRKITPAGVVSTYAGTGAAGLTNGPAATSTFNFPVALTLDAGGNMYVADNFNHVIRKITPAGIVSTFAGSGTAGFADGTGTVAGFNAPFGLAADAAGNIFVADADNQRVRKISPAGIVSTVAGTGVAGNTDGPAASAKFNRPMGVVVDPVGNLYVTDQFNDKIRKITPAGLVTTFAGSGTPGYADGAGTAAKFYRPVGIAADATGNLYVTDGVNNRIRKITPAGLVSTVAGSGAAGAMNGPASLATFNFPVGIITDASNNIYIGDETNNLIRKISAPAGCNIVFSGVSAACNGTVPGSGAPAYSLVPSFTNNSGQAISGFTVSSTQATILSGGAQGAFPLGASTAAAIGFSNPSPMPLYFDFTFTMADNSQCLVRVTVDYPACPPASCTCNAWPASVSYQLMSKTNPSPQSGTVGNGGALVIQGNTSLAFPGLTAPCSSPACPGELTYELYDPSNNLVPAGPKGHNFSSALRTQPCSNAGVYKLVIRAACGGVPCPLPFIIILSKPCYSPPMTLCGTPVCSADDANTNSVGLSVSGGTAPFTYAWSDGSTNRDLSNVMPGQYSVTVTDANGFKVSGAFSISCPPRCNFYLKANMNYTITSGQSLAIGSAAEPGISYSWFSIPAGFSSSLPNPTVSPAVTTTYYLVRRNANPACPPKTNTVLVTVN